MVKVRRRISGNLIVGRVGLVERETETETERESTRCMCLTEVASMDVQRWSSLRNRGSLILAPSEFLK